MKFTYNWLKDYLDTDASPTEVADTLTRIGLEVEDVIEPVFPIAAKIIECDKHPDSDHLHVLKVDDGSGTLRQVVCGAPNARVGLVSALAVPGCKIGDMEIKSGKLRGVLSDGMMCSGRELGIGDDHNGIIELDKGIKIGSEIKNRDLETVFDAGITPNRPDYLAVRGIALDLAASGLGKFIHKYDNYKGEMRGGVREAVVENYDACPVYYLCEIKNIKMAPSNPTIASRLQAIGINPKNAPIDATNYICYDLAQPMHCFDADEIHGDIVVRNAKPGEKFTDLFGNEHELKDTDLVITDSEGILALAGVVGGMRGSTTDKTTNVLLESAYFDPVTVRKTAKRIGVSTDASYRYERGIDPTISFWGIMRAVKIITDVCGGEVEASFRDWDKNNPKIAFMAKAEDMENLSSLEAKKVLDPRRIKYAPSMFLKKTGVDLSADKQKEILERLGYGVEVNGDDWTIIPTSARVDVTIAEAVIADLIRLYGYDNIKQDKSITNVKFETKIPAVKKALIERGFYECLNYGFGDSAREKILNTRPNISVLNPIIDTFDTVRNSLVQAMLDTIANNDRFRRSNLSLFELAAVFDGAQPGQQHDQLVIARTGVCGDKFGVKHGAPVSIYDIRGDLMALFPNAVVETDDNAPLWANPYRAGRLILDGKIVATFAELHPAVAKKFGIKTNVVIGVVDNVSGLVSPADWTGVRNDGVKISLGEYPLITRDFAFVAPNDLDATTLLKIAGATDERIIETNLFDVFDLGDGTKSIAFEIVLQPTDNMSDTDLQALHQAVIASVESNSPAKLRG